MDLSSSLANRTSQDVAELTRLKQDSLAFRDYYASSMQKILEQLEESMKENNQTISNSLADYQKISKQHNESLLLLLDKFKKVSHLSC